MKRFNVPVFVSGFVNVEVVAEDVNKAKELALAEAGEMDFGELSDVNWEIANETSIISGEIVEGNIRDFWCNDLSKYVDSMLFESGTQIAECTYRDEYRVVVVSLEVRGEVNVEYNGETYRSVCDFPEELKDIFRKGDYFSTPNEESNLWIDSNNWFEYIYTVTNLNSDGTAHNRYSDGVMCDYDLSTASKEDVKQDMIDIIKDIVG